MSERELNEKDLKDFINEVSADKAINERMNNVDARIEELKKRVRYFSRET